MKKIYLLCLTTFFLKITGYSQAPFLVKDLNPGSSIGYNYYSTPMSSVQSRYYFQGNDGSTGYEASVTDGTSSGTYVLKDMVSGATGTSINDYYLVNNVVNFEIVSSFNKEIWKTDNTTAGTIKLLDPSFSFVAGGITDRMVFNDTLYVLIVQGNSDAQIIKIDPSLNNPTNIHTLAQSNFGPLSFSYFLTTATNHIVFVANDTIWTTNGGLSGTNKLGTGIAVNHLLGSLNKKVYFFGYDPTHGYDLWVTDGTSANTNFLADLTPGNSSTSAPFPYSYVNTLFVDSSFMFFNAQNAQFGEELYVTDGTALGSFMLKDIKSGSGSSVPNDVHKIGTKYIFTCADTANNRELWVTDGTQTGTVKLMEIEPGTLGSSPQNFIAFKNGYIFSATTSSSGKELWFTDGTPGNTYQITNIDNGSNNSFQSIVLVDGNSIYISGNDGVNGNELYVSDGTANNATLIKDINTGGLNSNPAYGIKYCGNIFFIATSSSTGKEVWKTDGTSIGTTLVSDINPGPNSSINVFNANSFRVVQNGVVFPADDGTHGIELWNLDACLTGISTINKEMDFVLYPNPAGNIIYLHNNMIEKDSRIEISTMDSKIIYNAVLNTENLEIGIKEFLPGMYFVKVIDGKNNRTTVKKFVKQ